MNECMTQEDAERMDNEQAIAILKPLRDMMRDQYGCPISDAYFAVGKAIEALSQPQRMKGRWVLCTEECDETFHTGNRCSVCNYWKPMGIWNYCPNCGADMRGDEK